MQVELNFREEKKYVNVKITLDIKSPICPKVKVSASDIKKILKEKDLKVLNFETNCVLINSNSERAVGTWVCLLKQEAISPPAPLLPSPKPRRSKRVKPEQKVEG